MPWRSWTTEATRKTSRTLTNPRVWYRIGVTFLIVIGLLGELLGHNRLHEGTFAQSTILGLSEALLISGILAVVVDPFLKQRIQEESAWAGIFGFLNERAPAGLRKSLQELAACEVFFPKTKWTLDFTWEDQASGVLSLTISVHSTGENISRKAHKLDGHLWILASTAGFQSEYLKYSASCPGAFTSVDVSGDELASYVTNQSDGSLVLNESSVCNHREIPAGKTFEIARQARMYRHKSGYVPLQHSRFGEELEIELRGPALNDVELRVTHPRETGRKKPSERKRPPSDRATPDVYRFSRITPGQVTIVSWKPSLQTGDLQG